TVEGGIDLAMVTPADSAKHRSGELASNYRRGLDDLLGHRRQLVEPRHQRALQGGWNFDRIRVRAAFTLEQRPRELLDEQRDAIGTGRDLGDQPLIGLLADHALDQLCYLRSGEPAERKRHHVSV